MRVGRVQRCSIRAKGHEKAERIDIDPFKHGAPTGVFGTEQFEVEFTLPCCVRAVFMIRTANLSLVLLLLSGTNAFVGRDVSVRLTSPCRTSFARRKLLCSVRTRRSSGSSSSNNNNASDFYQAEERLEQQVGATHYCGLWRLLSFSLW